MVCPCAVLVRVGAGKEVRSQHLGLQTVATHVGVATTGCGGKGMPWSVGEFEVEGAAPV